MSDEYEIHRNKLPGKTYISRSLAFADQNDRRIRIASKVFDSPETHMFALEHGEHVVRVTEGGRHEIVAKFYEDNRQVSVLTLQRFTAKTGVPHQTHFSFVGEEIPKLLEFIGNLCAIQFPDRAKVNITDSELKKILLSPEQARSVVVQNQELMLELARSTITKSDLVAIGFRCIRSCERRIVMNLQFVVSIPWDEVQAVVHAECSFEIDPPAFTPPGRWQDRSGASRSCRW